jgi:hypothetical protein
VTQYLNENESNFSLAENAIENTQEFLDRLMRVEIPKNSPKSEKPKNFSQNQKARMSVINDRKNQRQKEMKIRLAAEKAARELEKQKFEENKKRENKKREIEEKLVNAEIHKLRTQEWEMNSFIIIMVYLHAERNQFSLRVRTGRCFNMKIATAECLYKDGPKDAHFCPHRDTLVF